MRWSVTHRVSGDSSDAMTLATSSADAAERRVGDDRLLELGDRAGIRRRSR
jgi:hypothetical protein